MANYISDLPLRSAYPADQETIIRDKNAPPLSATTAETALSFMQGYDLLVAVNVSAYAGYVESTAEWVITVEASADNVSFTVLRTLSTDGTEQQLDTAISKQEMAGYRYIRTTATTTGSPEDLQYGAFIAGC